MNVFVEKKFFVWINKIQPHSSLPLRSTKDAKKRISITILLRILSSSKAKPILSFTVVKLIRSYKNLLRQIFEQNHEQNFCFFPKKERINFRNLRKKVIFSSIFAELQAWTNRFGRIFNVKEFENIIASEAKRRRRKRLRFARELRLRSHGKKNNALEALILIFRKITSEQYILYFGRRIYFQGEPARHDTA